TGGITDAAGNGLATEFTSSFTTVSTIPVDLSTWSQEGAPANGTWTVSSDGQSVLQTDNNDPTFFVSPDPVINQTVTGKFKVEAAGAGDDDLIGFVFGFQAPSAADGDNANDFDFWLFDWKQGTQSYGGGLAEEGFALSRVKGTIATSYYLNFWDHPTGSTTLWDYPADGTAFDTIATDYGSDRGWADDTEYDFTLEYFSNLIRISIQSDGDSRFATPQVIFEITPDDVWGTGTDRTFVNGRFGFYNFSQAYVSYTGFVQELETAPPAPTLSAVSPTGAAPTQALTVHLSGTDLQTADTVLSSDPDVDARILSANADGSDLEVELNIGAGAGPGTVDLQVQTLGGTTAPIGFIVDDPPSLTSITPADGFQEQTLKVDFVGTGLGFADAVISSDPAITGTITTKTDTTVTAVVTVGAGAASGTAYLGLHTPVGDASLPFEVFPATAVDFTDFSDLSALTLNGATATLGNPVSFGGQDVLRLTDDYNQGGSAFLTDTIDLEVGGLPASFSTAFEFQITDPGGISDSDGSGADGLVFVVQTVASSVGGGGSGIGYAGIDPSVAVEFDTFYNSGTDGTGNEVGIDLNGSLASVARAAVTTRMNDGDVWYAWIDYDGASGVLEARLSQTPLRPTAALVSYSMNLADVLGASHAYVGFTSGTALATGDHDIRAWKLRNTYAPFGDW
ncbi:MAG: hypothetical protein LJE69_13295, partial [Thiohalocapsa sp.]|uniref:lectin-like domain-containing protein n=1 Tax=Thiohalocapsa sp. TaxID=2497641 RepID=UPI0025CCE06D